MNRWLSERGSSWVNALGYTLLPTWRIPRLALAERLKQILSDNQIETVIDVGANEGGYRDFLRDQVGFKGRIESFEPVPEIAGRLQNRAASDPLWTIHACALGAICGELNLNVMAATDFSSFRKPISAGSPAQNRMNTIARIVTVPVSTPDSEFNGRSLARCYLKLDTQGYDLEILRGGERSIRQIPALQTEVSFRALYEGMPDYKQAIAAFEQFGFRVADLFLVSMDDANRAIEFDCLMVRQALGLPKAHED